jgi:hypothetical protein
MEENTGLWGHHAVCVFLYDLSLQLWSQLIDFHEILYECYVTELRTDFIHLKLLTVSNNMANLSSRSNTSTA